MVDNVNNISTLTQNTAGVQSTKGRVLSAIKAASARSGVDFSYLLNKAVQESSLNPTAKAPKSSATGLYQFIDQTWLKTVKANGADYGLSDMADKISVGSDGIARVANSADKKAILALRSDPEVSANMAAELAKTNKEQLQKQVGGKIGATEMYMAHFLGAGGASAFLTELKENPNAIAADILPTAADANKSVFYDKTTGEAKTVGEIYKKFAAKFDKMPDIGVQDIQVASADTSAQKIETRLANEMTLASLSNSTSGAISSSMSSNMTMSNGVKLGQSMSSPFATMMLAQMDMETFGLDAKADSLKTYKSDEERQKSVLQTLASVS